MHHVNLKNKIGVCKATKKPCPYSSERHFETSVEAENFVQQQLIEEFGKIPESASISKNSNNTENFKVLSSHSHRGEMMERLSEVDRAIFEDAVLYSADRTLSLSKVVDEDEQFRAEINSNCEVRRITLENGLIGYFKPLDDEDLDCYDAFSTDPFGVMMNEVNSYRFANALGFDGLVPETVLKVNDGRIGSIQLEGQGITGHQGFIGRKFNADSLRYASNFRQAMIFDYLIGAADRHNENYLYDQNTGKITLIDNGFNFQPKEHHYYRELEFAEEFNDHSQLTPEEVDNIRRLYDDPEMAGLRKSLRPKQYEALRARMAKAIDTGEVYSDGVDAAYEL